MAFIRFIYNTKIFKFGEKIFQNPQNCIQMIRNKKLNQKLK